MVNVVANLSQEDLSRWRMVCANKELVDNSHTGLSVSEGKQYILDYYKQMGDIFNTYNLDVAHISCYYISPFTGHILLEDE